MDRTGIGVKEADGASQDGGSDCLWGSFGIYSGIEV